MRFHPRTLIALSGLVWLAIGTFLLQLGLRFLIGPASTEGFSLLSLLSPYFKSPQNSVAVLLTLSLMLGYIKGRTVLRKSAERQVERLINLPKRSSITQLYTRGQLLLIASMITLGISMRFFPITLDTRGAIDIAIGFALMNGGLLYFRSAFNYKYLKNPDLDL